MNSRALLRVLFIRDETMTVLNRDATIDVVFFFGRRAPLQDDLEERGHPVCTRSVPVFLHC